MHCPECGTENVKVVMVDANIKSTTITRYHCLSPDCSFSFQVSHNSKRPEQGSGGGGAGPVPIRSLISDVVACDRCGNAPAGVILIAPDTGRVRRMCLMCKIHVFGAMPI